MIARLNEIDSVVTYHIDQSMLLRDPARPDIPPQVFQRLGLADPAGRIAQHRLDQCEKPQRGAPFGIDVDDIASFGIVPPVNNLTGNPTWLLFSRDSGDYIAASRRSKSP